MKIGEFKLLYGKLIIAGVCILSVTIFSAISFAYHDVVIKVDNKEMIYSYNGRKTVSEILEENNIDINEYDKISHPKDEIVENGEKINIERARPVIIEAKGKKYKVITTEKKAEKILEESNINIGPLDIVNTDKEVPDQIYITSVSEEIETIEEVIDHKRIVRKNAALELGTEKILQVGKDGLKTTVVKIVFHDGIEFSREIIEEKINEPIDEIVEVGTKNKQVVSRGNIDGKKVILEATGYCSCYKCCAPYDGTRTASGTAPIAGRTIAASKKYRFGTKIYIPSLNTTYIVEDRGGAIVGNKIDIYFNSHQEALNFGRRMVEAIILE